MKRNLPKSLNSINLIVWMGLITCCLLAANTKVRAGQKIGSDVEQEMNSSHTYSLSADNRETNDSSTTETVNKVVQNQPWEPPPPPPDDFDWIQLTSGEWLKGKLKVLYEKRLEFDSEELGLLEFDWEDVKQVRGHGILSARFVGPFTVEGVLQITEDKVFLTVGEEKQEFKRDQLVAIAPGAPREIDYWSAKISLGLNVTKGNTDQLQYSTIANIKRRTSATRFIIDYLGNFTKSEGVETVNNQRLNSYFDIFKTRKYFFRPFFGEYYADPFQNIDRRFTVGAGMGYHIIDTSKTQWDVAGGPAYQTTRFSGVEPGRDSSESTPAFVVGTEFNTELTKTVDFDYQYRFQLMNEESGRYTHHMVAAFETELTGWLDFDVSLIWDRIQEPQPRTDGSVPKQDDYYMIFSLGIDL